MIRLALSSLFLSTVAALSAAEPSPPPQSSPALVETKPVPKGFLGIETAPIDPGERGDFGLAPDQEGVVVTGVVPGGPAQQGGLKAGDILLAIAEKPCGSPEALAALARDLAPDQTVTVRYLRDDRPGIATLVVTAPPAEAEDPDAKEARRHQEQMLAMLPPGMRAKLTELQQLARKKEKELREKLEAEGFSEQDIQARVHSELINDPAFQRIQKELQQMAQELGGGLRIEETPAEGR